MWDAVFHVSRQTASFAKARPPSETLELKKLTTSKSASSTDSLRCELHFGFGWEVKKSERRRKICISLRFFTPHVFGFYISSNTVVTLLLCRSAANLDTERSSGPTRILMIAPGFLDGPSGGIHYLGSGNNLLICSPVVRSNELNNISSLQRLLEIGLAGRFALDETRRKESRQMTRVPARETSGFFAARICCI